MYYKLLIVRITAILVFSFSIVEFEFSFDNVHTYVYLSEVNQITGHADT